MPLAAVGSVPKRTGYARYWYLIFHSTFIADYALNSILYQRGVYPPENFSRAQKYGLTLLVARDDDLVTKYLNTILEQVKGKEI